MDHKQVILKCSAAMLCLLFSSAVLTSPIHATESSVTVVQQTKTVTGMVVDEQGVPLLGVNVSVPGTTTGTITDINGNFSLEVPNDAQLIFSYIGFTSLTISSSQDLTKVVLKEDTQKLDEVVVVGYGTQQKKDITGSVAVVDTKELLSSSGSSAITQLQGRAAGVNIGSTGAPGSATMVRIRGINTINDNGPLYVIDGVSSREQDLSSLNPNDIESMQILKDASSAAIYGAQAANGVIVITTKKGRSGTPRLSYDGYFGGSKTATRYDLLNAYDRIDIEWQARKNALDISGASANGELPTHAQFGTTSDSFVNHIPNLFTVAGSGGRQDIDPNDYSFPDNVMTKFSDTDWWDEVSQVGWMQSHQVSLQGGSDKGNYILSANYFDNKGTIIESEYKRYSVRANSTFQVRPWLRFGENLTYTFNESNGISHSATESTIYSWTYRACPYIPVYDIQGNYAGSKIGGTGNFQNPVAIQERNKDNYSSSNRIFGNIYAEADLYKGLTFKTSFGMDYRNAWWYYISKYNPEFSESGGINSFTEAANYNYRWVWTNTMTYNTRFNENHSLNIMLGTEAIKDGLGRNLSGYRTNYLFEDNTDTWTLNMGENNGLRTNSSSFNGRFALFGIFGRVDYAYKDKYLLTGIVRRDGVSRFAKDNRYGTFPSVSLGWRLSQEDFMQGTNDWLDDLKLRVGYGQSGNSEIPVATNFANLFTTDPSYTNYDFSGSNTGSDTGYRLSTYGNTNTKWESTNMWNVGLDATFLGGKFNTTIEWYTKKTSNMLIQAAYSSLAGESGSPYINYGDIKNTGFDVSFNYRDKAGDFAWDISLNLSHYKNEVQKLAEADDYSLWASGTRLEGYVTRTTKGHAISEFWGYKQNGFYETAADVLSCLPIGESNMTEEAAKQYIGKFRFEDVNGDGKLDDNDQTFIGSPHPDLTAGLNATLTYKNIDFTMFWNSSFGNDLYNNTKYFTDFWTFNGNKSTTMRDESWTPGANNSNAVLPILDASDTYSGTYSSSYYVENATYLRLQNLVLGYSLPKNLLKKATIESLRIYLQAENLVTFTGYSGLDPAFTNAYMRQSDTSVRVDLQKGVDMGGWPTTRRFLVGINFVF